MQRTMRLALLLESVVEYVALVMVLRFHVLPPSSLYCH